MENSGVPFQQAEGFYRHLFDSSPDVLMMIDGQGKIQVVNSRCREVLGYSVEEVEGRRVQDLLAVENRSTFDMMLTGVFEGTPMPEAEVDIQTKADLPIPMMLDVRQIEEEGAGHFLLRLRDLREIKGLEQEYRDLFESIADAVFIGDVESGQFYQANRQACDLTGYALGELMGAEYDRVHSDSWEVIQREVEKGNGGGERARNELEDKGRGGGTCRGTPANCGPGGGLALY